MKQPNAQGENDCRIVAFLAHFKLKSSSFEGKLIFYHFEYEHVQKFEFVSYIY
jgi:hypothetical protein